MLFVPNQYPWPLESSSCCVRTVIRVIMVVEPLL